MAKQLLLAVVTGASTGIGLEDGRPVAALFANNETGLGTQALSATVYARRLFAYPRVAAALSVTVIISQLPFRSEGTSVASARLPS